VQCATHGTQQRTYVCQHIVHGLRERERVGFFWATEDPTNPRPDAWCAACNERVRKTDGEWIDEAVEHLGISIICGACYDAAKTFHMGGDPWS
jgi:hypothetical protein